MMERVRSSRSTSGGVEVARRRVAEVAAHAQRWTGRTRESSRTYIRSTLPTSSDGGGDE